MELTDKQIEQMPAGLEMDELVAEKVMGWIAAYSPTMTDTSGHTYKSKRLVGPLSEVPEYSTDIAAAWTVVEKLKSLTPHGDIHIEHLDGLWGVSSCYENAEWDAFKRAETAPLAICRHALSASRREGREGKA